MRTKLPALLEDPRDGHFYPLEDLRHDPDRARHIIAARRQKCENELVELEALLRYLLSDGRLAS